MKIKLDDRPIIPDDLLPENFNRKEINTAINNQNQYQKIKSKKRKKRKNAKKQKRRNRK